MQKETMRCLTPEDPFLDQKWSCDHNSVSCPHLLVTCSGEGHLQVVKPGRSDSIEPVNHFLWTSKQTHTLGDSVSCFCLFSTVTYSVCFGLWVNTEFVQVPSSLYGEVCSSVLSECCSAVDKSTTEQEWQWRRANPMNSGSLSWEWRYSASRGSPHLILHNICLFPTSISLITLTQRELKRVLGTLFIYPMVKQAISYLKKYL